MAVVKMKRKLEVADDASNKIKKKFRKEKVKSEKQFNEVSRSENRSGAEKESVVSFENNDNKAKKFKKNFKNDRSKGNKTASGSGRKIFKSSKQGVKSKPNWLEFKKKKKELKQTRREGNNPQYEMNFRAKKIWETCRSHNFPKEKLVPLTKELHSILKGKLSLVVHSHDMARVVQFMLKRADVDVRQEVCDELVPHLDRVILSKYGCYCVKPLFVHSNSNRRKKLVDALCGHVVKLLNHSIASKWLEYVYSTWASNAQKLSMRQEMYGKLFNLSKRNGVANLSELFEKDEATKSAVLSSTKAVITKAMQKQHIMVSSLLHSVLLDYFNHCSEVDKSELCESLVESIMQLLTSRDGTILAMNIVWLGTNKTKKTIVKLLKTHVKEVSQLEHGHLLLITLFDSVDDTVLIKKAMLPELLGVAEELAVDEIGRRVLLHLVAHRDKSHFHPVELELLRKGDELGTSKKDAAIKHQELLGELMTPLLGLLANNPGLWLSSSSICILTLAILKVAVETDGVNVDELKSVHTAIASHLLDVDNISVVEDVGVHFLLKKLIQHEASVVAKDSSKASSTLSFSLVDNVSEDTLEKWVKVNRACFILVRLIECGGEEMSITIKGKINKQVRHILKKESTAGAKLLYKTLTEK